MDSAPPPAGGYGSNINSTRSNSVDESILCKHVSSGLPEPLSEERAHVAIPSLPASPCPSSSFFVYSMDYEDVCDRYRELPKLSAPHALSSGAASPVAVELGSDSSTTSSGSAPSRPLHTVLGSPHPSMAFRSSIPRLHPPRPSLLQAGYPVIKITRLDRLSTFLRARILLNVSQTATQIVSGTNRLTCCIHSFTDGALPLSMDCGTVPASWMLSANRDFSGTRERARTWR